MPREVYNIVNQRYVMLFKNKNHVFMSRIVTPFFASFFLETVLNHDSSINATIREIVTFFSS